jgi:hypothetical protein
VANEELFIDLFAPNLLPRCGEEYSQNAFLLRAFSRAAAKAFNS